MQLLFADVWKDSLDDESFLVPAEVPEPGLHHVQPPPELDRIHRRRGRRLPVLAAAVHGPRLQLGVAGGRALAVAPPGVEPLSETK